MSSQIQFEVANQIITRKDNFKPVADSKNYLYAQFDFLTYEWTGSITAIFTKGNISYKMLLDEDNKCLIPWELLVDGGNIFVSCFCGDLVTANSSRIYVAASGYVADAENEEPATPSIYSQITDYVDSLREDFEVIDGGVFGDERDNQ